MRVLLVSHALPEDAWPGAKRISWMLDLLPTFGVETRLLVLRFVRTKLSAGAAGVSSKKVTVVGTPTRDVPHVWMSLADRDGGFERTMLSAPGTAEAVRRGVQIADDFKPDFVLATTPSPRNVEIGYRISLATRVPLVIDWRDPASLRPLRTWPSRSFYEALARRERTWISHAVLNVATAPSFADRLAATCRGACVELVTNGFAPAADAKPAEVRRGTILYSGSMVGCSYGFASRFPDGPKARALGRVSRGRLYFAPHAREVDYRSPGLTSLEALADCRDALAALIVRGGRPRGDARKAIRRLSLSERLTLLPWTTPSEARSELSLAHVLWMCLGGVDRINGEPVISTKVFDYLASGRPIFAALPPACDTARILRGREGVFMPDPGDERAMDEALREALSTPPGKSFERDIDEYRHDRLAARMGDVLKSVAAAEAPPVGEARA